jgi:glycosyltransferase involved in cell wall biosynthesis
MGRLSMEKNHLAMIEAFKRLYDENQNVRLHILGEGPLKDEEERLIKKYSLQNKVRLTGNLSNPFAYIKHCDCYLMPSLHEGQPMAILEARMMKMPIIVSDFSTIKDSLYENGQLLIKKDVDSIYEGMKAFIEGKVPNEFVFKVEEYNQLAMKEFLNNLSFNS